MTDRSNTPSGDGEAGNPPGLGTLLFRGGVMGILLAAAMSLVLVFVPDGNDYAKAAQLKGERLMTLPGNRIVMIGGSNLAFGIDSRLIESLAGCPVANMGMNGYFGVRFMLAEADAGLRRGDVAVIALEYDSFVKSVEGSGADLLMVGKTVPRTVKYMTFRQVASGVTQIPFVVRSKMSRVAGEAFQGMYDAALGSSDPDPAGPDINAIESLSGFTPEGDLVAHLDVEWQGGHEDGLDLTELPVDPKLFPLIREFSERMNERGVDVVFSYSPVMRRYYIRHQPAIERVHAMARQELEGVAAVPSDPGVFVYEEDSFFDTVYHLGREGREHRSRLVAQDIAARDPGTDHCRGATFSESR